MSQLREFALSLPLDERDERHGLLRITQGARGVQVGFDINWLWLFSLARYYGDRFNDFDGKLRPFRAPLARPPVPEAIDEDWYCQSWLDWNGGQRVSPYVVRVLMSGETRRMRFFERDYIYDSTFVLLERDTPVRVVYELRRPSRLQVARVWQTRGNYGSAGGVLDFPGLGPCTTTAGHVASHLGMVRSDRSGREKVVGECIHFPDYAAGGLSDETALIRLAPPADWERPASTLLAITSDDIGIGRPLAVLGVRSRHTDLYANEYIRYRTLTSPDSTVRIDDGFELRRRKEGIFGGRFKRPTRPGDSGAWIVRRGTVNAWAGSVVGGDDVSTVATFATHTIQHLSAKFGTPSLL